MEQLGQAEAKVETGGCGEGSDETGASGGADFCHVVNTFQESTMHRILGLEARQGQFYTSRVQKGC